MISSKYQTKNWRKEQVWWKGGKRNECEKFQKENIKRITGYNLKNTKKRINKETFEIRELKFPLKEDNGREWSEDFDGETKLDRKTFYWNLKFVCDSGGAQNRTLSLVYDMIKCQLEFLNISSPNIFFINILDGDESFKNKKFFNYLLSKEKYINKQNLFCGDSHEFETWWKNF